ncbi:MAG: type II CAAX endopeptidase family protein [Pseudomonadota bacterium]
MKTGDESEQYPNTTKTPWISLATGLSISLVLTTLFWIPSIVGNLLPSNIVARNVASQVVDWAFAISLIIVVLLGERKPIASMGFKPFTFQAMYEAFGLVGFFFIGMIAWRLLVSPWFPGISLPAGQAATGELPENFFLWFAPFALLTASFAEEIIYRGYAMERLLTHFKNPLIALVLPHTAFALYHLKDGFENAVMLFFVGWIFTWYYYKSRNLTLLILAHFIIDLLAIVGRIAGID